MARRKCSIGAERTERGYIYVKVNDSGKWRLKHHLIWEAANGPIPDGQLIRFIDGDKSNLALNNLALMSKQERGHILRKKQNAPLGSEEIRADKYVLVKVAEPNIWRFKHHLIWEAANGPIPDGQLIRFIDGDRSNLALNNLTLMSAQERGHILRARKNAPLGSQNLHDGKYIKIKIAEPNTWRFKHHLIWEAANGPIPDGYILCFADDNPNNFQLDNLVLINKKEKLRHFHQMAQLPLGTETPANMKQVLVKIAQPDVWRLKHHLIWEAANGPIPENHTVHFADRNYTNFQLNNLLLVSMEERGQILNKKMSHLKGDLFRTAVNLAKLNIAVEKRLKRLKQQKYFK